MEPTTMQMVSERAKSTIVKVFAEISNPDNISPWQNKPPRHITGSGFVIYGRRIMTNAHVVADQTFVLVRKHGSSTKFRAEVQVTGHECDLALLKVNDENFWEGITFLEFGNIPYLEEAVAVVGYPQGGDSISVTKGVVSRIGLLRYEHGVVDLMAIQTDAAINPGNSGGPAIMNDKVAGVAFQCLPGGDNIGYIIPVPIIEHFLADVDVNGEYIGFCTLGATYQTTGNIYMRDHLKMPPGLTGVLVNKVYPLCNSHLMLKKNDVIVAFDGSPIANDGTVHFRNSERIPFDHLVSIKKSGETGAVRVFRDHVHYEFHIKLEPCQPLVPVHQFDKVPSYFIFGGLVFSPLTWPYLREKALCGHNTSLRRLHQLACNELPHKRGEQIIILSQVLMDDTNIDYEHLSGFQVEKVNGKVIYNLKHLHWLVKDCKKKSICFDLDSDKKVVLNYKSAEDAASRILEKHRIPSAMSCDLEEDEEREEMECPEWAEKHISTMSLDCR